MVSKGEYVLGVDIDRQVAVPPLIPEVPLMRGIDHIVGDLADQLSQAHSLPNGQATACILVAEERGYGGHSSVNPDGTIVDAITMALGEGDIDNAKIQAVVVAGLGPKPEKHALPTREAYAVLRPLLATQAPIININPNTGNTMRVIPPALYRQAYELPFETHAFTGTTFEEIVIEAHRNTLLSVDDCRFMAKLRLGGMQNGIQAHLGGSSSALGGPSNALHPESYGDLDILLVSELDKREVRDWFTEIAAEHYGDIVTMSHPVVRGATNEIVHGNTLTGKQITIDLFIGRTLAEIAFRNDILEPNRLHKIC